MTGVENGKKNTLFLTLVGYTLCWLPAACALLLIFRINHKTFFWNPDGFFFHFAAFSHICDYLEGFLFGTYGTPMFQYSLGQGMDILSAVGGYDFCDPISWFTAPLMFLSRQTRYTVMVFIKLFLVGVSFITYCHVTDRRNRLAVLAGAIAYTFSGAILFSFARHPNFACWGYFFPFLLAGIEWQRRKNRSMPLILAVFLQVLANYYVFYMDAVLAVIYVLVSNVFSVLDQQGGNLKNKLSAELKKDLLLMLSFLTGIFLSAFALFPIIHGYLDNSRVAVACGYIDSMFRWPLFYYEQLFVSLFSFGYSPGFSTYLGLNVATAISVILLFTKRREYRELKTLLVICFFMLCIPLAARVMNGFGYASNRWCYAVAFYVSMALVVMFDEMRKMASRKRYGILMLLIIYLLLCFLYKDSRQDVRIYAALILLISYVIIIFLIDHFCEQRLTVTVLVLTVACAVCYVCFSFGQRAGDHVSEYIDIDDAQDWISSSTVAVGREDAFYRVDDLEDNNNECGFHHVFGTSTIWGVIPQHMLDYHRDMALISLKANSQITGLDGRAGLLALAGVKYYTKPAGEDSFVPYGYVEQKSSDKRFALYENPDALPIGYIYDHCIELSEYRNLDPLEKEQALLQGAVLECVPEGISAISPQTQVDVLDYQIEEESTASWDGEKLTSERDGKLLISADVPENCEIFLGFKNLEWNGIPSGIDLRFERRNGGFQTRKSGSIRSRYDNWYYERADYVVDLGSGGAGKNAFSISFSDGCSLSCDDLFIAAVPMEQMCASIKKLGSNVLENITVSDDHVKGTVRLTENGILQLAIPYNIGWHAFVDGEECELVQSDVLYMALTLKPGVHEVELRYQTPYLKEGVCVSLLTLILYTFFLGLMNYKRKKSMSRTN